MIKKIALMIMVATIFFVLADTSLETIEHIDISSKKYYLENAFKETGSSNIVTGIYLDYRLFDTIFEASILLIAVSGIIYMSKRDDEIR